MEGIGWGISRMDERGLIGHAQAGDASAFSALFEEYHGPITGYLYHLVGDRDLADDLAQETFVKAYRALGRTSDGLNFRAWVYRIATNTANSYFRRRRIIKWLPLGPTTPEPASEPRFTDAIGEQEMIVATLRRIRPSHASILLLRHQQGLSLDEIADALDITVNAAKVRLFRARKAFIAAYAALSGETEDAG